MWLLRACGQGLRSEKVALERFLASVWFLQTEETWYLGLIYCIWRAGVLKSGGILTLIARGRRILCCNGKAAFSV